MEEQTLHVGIRERLFARLWTDAQRAPRGLVIIVHGLGEHGGRYAPVAERLTMAGWNTLAIDLPGHGHSPGRRGHIASYDALLREFAVIRQQAEQRLSDLPQFILGHSMGGNLVVNYAIRRHRFETQLDGSCSPLRESSSAAPCSCLIAHLRVLRYWLRG